VLGGRFLTLAKVVARRASRNFGKGASRTGNLKL